MVRVVHCWVTATWEGERETRTLEVGGATGVAAPPPLVRGCTCIAKQSHDVLKNVYILLHFYYTIIYMTCCLLLTLPNQSLVVKMRETGGRRGRGRRGGGRGEGDEGERDRGGDGGEREKEREG